MNTTKPPLKPINELFSTHKVTLTYVDEAPITPGAKRFFLSINSINDNPANTSISYIERSNAELMEYFQCASCTISQWLDELSFINALWIAYKPIRINGTLKGKERKIFTNKAFYEMFLKENPDYQGKKKKSKNPRKIARSNKADAIPAKMNEVELMGNLAPIFKNFTKEFFRLQKEKEPGFVEYLKNESDLPKIALTKKLPMQYFLKAVYKDDGEYQRYLNHQIKKENPGFSQEQKAKLEKCGIPESHHSEITTLYQNSFKNESADFFISACMKYLSEAKKTTPIHSPGRFLKAKQQDFEIFFKKQKSYAQEHQKKTERESDPLWKELKSLPNLSENQRVDFFYQIKEGSRTIQEIKELTQLTPEVKASFNNFKTEQLIAEICAILSENGIPFAEIQAKNSLLFSQVQRNEISEQGLRDILMSLKQKISG